MLYHSTTQYTPEKVNDSTMLPMKNQENLITKYSLNNTAYSGYLMYTRPSLTKVNGTYYISECDIVVDADDNWNINGTSTTDYDVQNSMTHEFGHMLGLAHSQYSIATMYGSVSPGEISKRTIEQDDINGINAIYDN